MRKEITFMCGDRVLILCLWLLRHIILTWRKI